jgi:hypothetical protein
MSSMTLVQIAEKPITVATEEAINNFADSRQGLCDGRSIPSVLAESFSAKPGLAAFLRRPNSIVCSQTPSMRPETLQRP